MQQLKRRIILIAVTVIFLSISSGVVIVISLLPDSEQSIPIILSYPEIPTVTIGSGNQSYFSIVFLLSTQGYLAENVPIQIVNASCVSYLPKNIIVKVIFPNAVNYELRQFLSSGVAIIGNNQREFLRFEDTSITYEHPNVTSFVHFVPPANMSEIYFPVSGDYSPTVRITVESQPEIIYTFDQIKVHVVSASELEGARLGRINLWLSYAFFGLSIFGIVWLLFELFEKKEENQVFNINISIAPDSIMASPTKNKPKTKDSSDVTSSKLNAIANKIEDKTSTSPENRSTSPKR